MTNRSKQSVGPKPTAVMSRNKLLYLLFYYTLHWLPASLMDLQLRIQGKEAKFAKLISRLFNVIDSLSPFTCNFWLYSNEHTEALLQSLSSADRLRFDFDARRIDWPTFYMTFGEGLRRFLLKEDRKLTWLVEGIKVPIPVPSGTSPSSMAVISESLTQTGGQEKRKKRIISRSPMPDEEDEKEERRRKEWRNLKAAL